MIVSREDVEKYLADMKKAVRDKRYIVSSRDKNQKLLRDFIFTEETRERILLDLCVEDYCSTVQNEHPRFAHEVLYIFGKDIALISRLSGQKKKVSLYIKFNRLENMYYIIVSFHEQEYSLEYAYK